MSESKHQYILSNSHRSIEDDVFARLYVQVDEVAIQLVRAGALPHAPSFLEVMTALQRVSVLTVNGQLTMRSVNRMFLPKLLEDAREILLGTISPEVRSKQ